MDGWVGGWMDGQMGGWMVGWMDNGISQMNISYFLQQFQLNCFLASVTGAIVKILNNRHWSRCPEVPVGQASAFYFSHGEGSKRTCRKVLGSR